MPGELNDRRRADSPQDNAKSGLGGIKVPGENRKRQRDVHEIRVIAAAVKGEGELSPHLWVWGKHPTLAIDTNVPCYRVTV